MKTKDFKRHVNELGFEINDDEDNNSGDIMDSYDQIATISYGYIGEFSTDFGGFDQLSYNQKASLLKLLFVYTKIPIDMRERT